MVKVGIVGLGVVGQAVKDGLERLGNEMLVHDIKLNTLIGDVVEADIVFICVPTKELPDGSCDISIVEDVLQSLTLLEYKGVVAIKSTVEPGTTAKLYAKYVTSGYARFADICFVPEFLRERSAFYDFTEGHDLLAVGTYSQKTFDLVVRIHGRYPKKTARLSVTEAELLKYYSNVYNALRVTFANGFYEICNKLGANYSKVKDTFILRGTATDMYLDCNEAFRGFGGPCLPKETAALANLSKRLGIPASIFSTIVEDNKLYKKTVPNGMRE